MKRLHGVAVAMMAIAVMAVADDKAAAPATAPAAAPAAAVKEEKSPLSFAATLDVYSAYVWRGNVINDRPVWQPGATVSYATKDYGTVSGNVWQNWDMTDHNEHRTFGGLNESDYTLSYTKDVGPVGVEVGHIWYTFPKVNGADYGHSTEEFYGGLSYNNDIVTPFVKVYGDYNVAEGLYSTAGLRKSISLSDRLTVGGSASLGMGDDHYMKCYFPGEDSTELIDGNLSINASYALTDHISIGATLAWMSLLDSSVRDTVDDTDVYHSKTDLLWGGINLAASF